MLMLVVLLVVLMLLVVVLMIKSEFSTSNLCKIELKKSKIHNRGVFAKELIKKGEIIEKIPLLEIPSKISQNNILNEYVIGSNECCYLMLGLGSLYNHSYTPNAIMKFVNKETVNICAIKDINVNEEILYNYGDDYLWKNEIKDNY